MLPIVLPACDEPQLTRCVAHLTAFPGALAIVVVNNPLNADSRTKQVNRETLRDLHGMLAEPKAAGPAVSWGQMGAGHAIIADRSADPWAITGGVGEARKTGADIAVCLGDNLGTDWILSTDADATPPHSLLAQLRDAPPDAAGATLPFRHVTGGDGPTDHATLAYEVRLRRHHLGLLTAGSPYAYIALGSALAVRRDAYVAVRGFPSRPAGEDFYMLNKLAKVGGIAQMAADPITIAARTSLRVPFGTGPAVSKAVADGREIQCYDPAVYADLNTLLDAADRALAYGQTLRDALRASSRDLHAAAMW